MAILKGLAKPARCGLYLRKPDSPCASPALTATGKVRQQTGQEGPNPLRGFWDSAAEPSAAGRRETVGPRPNLSGFEDGLGHLPSVQIDESDLVHSTASQVRSRIGTRRDTISSSALWTSSSHFSWWVIFIDTDRNSHEDDRCSLFDLGNSRRLRFVIALCRCYLVHFYEAEVQRRLGKEGRGVDAPPLSCNSESPRYSHRRCNHPMGEIYASSSGCLSHHRCF